MRLTTNKDLMKLIREKSKQGWTFTRHRGHIKARHESGRMTTISITPSDFRAMIKIEKALA